MTAGVGVSGASPDVGSNLEKRGKKKTGKGKKKISSALHYYLLEPEGEPAIVPETKKKR